MDSIEIVLSLTLPGERVFVVRDERGASEYYEAYSLHCKRGDRMVWTEGIRKDRSQMISSYRQAVDTAIATLNRSAVI